MAREPRVTPSDRSPPPSGLTAVFFPGQGSQSVGMVGKWCDANPAAAELFTRASAILGYDLAAICKNGPVDHLNTTVISQPAILVTSLAMLEVLKSRADNPLGSVSMAAGLSLGEYTALVFAGSIDFDDAVRLVDVRGRAMQECAEVRPGTMLAVLGLDRESIQTLCDQVRGGDVLALANVLCPGNCVVSGSAEACQRLAEAAEAAGAMKCVRLEVAGAFHTPMMEPAVAHLRDAIAAVTIRSPRIRVVSNVDARPHNDPADIRRLLARQVVGVVEWQASVEYMLSVGVGSIWEVGPGRVLRGLMKRIDRSVVCSGVLDSSDP
ncbi:MAG: ACP S-malonyltransferase [Planctomycetia bacterium]|nr:ACP S-malonyltransferase [Planctomycetia bacterium]